VSRDSIVDGDWLNLRHKKEGAKGIKRPAQKDKFLDGGRK